MLDRPDAPPAPPSAPTARRRFDKRHADVLRDIEELFEDNPNLEALNWIRPTQ